MLAGSDGGILPGASAGTCPGVCQWWEEPAAASALGGGGAGRRFVGDLGLNAFHHGAQIIQFVA